MNMLFGIGLIALVGRMGTYSWEGVGSVQLVCFQGRRYGMGGVNMLGGLGLIVRIRLGIGAFLGVHTMSAIGCGFRGVSILYSEWIR